VLGFPTVNISGYIVIQKPEHTIIIYDDMITFVKNNRRPIRDLINIEHNSTSILITYRRGSSVISDINRSVAEASKFNGIINRSIPIKSARTAL
jgi:hypothetical protein